MTGMPMPASDLLARLPKTRGKMTPDASLAALTWFRTGGVAEVLFRPVDSEDLALFLRERPADVAVTVIGLGSNLLIRDGGISGVVIKLGRGFARVATVGTEIYAGAAALDLTVALTAQDAGIAGLEFLSGVPGTIGGAVMMNAGAYGREIKDVAVSAEAVDSQGRIHAVAAEDMGFAYRRSQTPADWIFTQAVLRGEKGDKAAIARRMAEIREAREASQPLRTRTGGSTFKNPPGAKAWELIDRAGCRGLRRGQAIVSEKHCNFLVNEGGASASDIEELGEEVRRRVRESTGVELEWEIKRIGRKAGGDAR